MTKKTYKDNKIWYSYKLEYISINEITNKKEKKSIADNLSLNTKQYNVNPKNLKLTNKLIEIFEKEFIKFNEKN